jgi:lipoate---protein ligase
VITKTMYYCSEQFVPYENLATEAYLLGFVPEGCCILYLWQNRKTVVIGKNQNCWKECNVSNLENDGGYLVRRLSGGGAVFHDLGNLNFTFLVRQEDYDVEKQLEVILRAVNLLGIHAEKSGRNDITVDGKKFSGNAFYTNAGHCYHHGTLLLQVDMEKLSRYLNVSREKLESKGVESVKSRVTNLIDYYPEITVDLMKLKLLEAFAQVYGIAPVKLDGSSFDRRIIIDLTQKFSSWDWIFGKKIAFTFEAERRFPWGNIQILLQVNKGIIEQSAVYSDAMSSELISGIQLAGCPFSSQAMSDKVRGLIQENDNSAGPILEDICRFLLEQEI